MHCLASIASTSTARRYFKFLSEPLTVRNHKFIQSSTHLHAMSSNNDTSTAPPSASSCPVNHEARAVWLRNANLDHGSTVENKRLDHKSNGQSPSDTPALPPSSSTQTCDSSISDQTPSATTTLSSTSSNPTRDSSSQQSLLPATTPSPSSSFSILPYLPFYRQRRHQTAAPKEQDLNTERQISSIPRVSLNTPGSSEDTNVAKKDQVQAASTDTTATTTAAAAASGISSGSSGGSGSSSNNNNDTNTTAGNWIYPSERMFFDAMRRKSYDPKAEDMRAIVPIHNAVNERAWKEIREWESGKGAEK